jgi:hypothetical protein
MLRSIMKTLGAVKGSNPVVEFKVGILERAMPAESSVVFGDMWKVDGFYTKKTLELGCKRAVVRFTGDGEMAPHEVTKSTNRVFQG